jgi:ribose transport system substrate-binding protein
MLIAGINDETAIGAVQAASAVGGQRDIAIVGHGGSPEMLEIIADPDSPCIGTVSFRAELYGPDLMSFALPVVQGRSTTPTHYVPCEFVSKRP